MNWHSLEKEFLDYAEDIEAVNIHYAWTPLGGLPDWEQERITRYMPLVQSETWARLDPPLPADDEDVSSPPKRRKKILKLPLYMTDPETGLLVDHYALHHYFEIFQSGHRHYSPLYTEAVVTSAGNPALDSERLASACPTDTITERATAAG